MGDLEILTQPLGDGVAGQRDPHALPLADLAPPQAAVGAHHAAKDLGKVPRVQHDQAHPLEDALLHAIDDRVLHLSMGHVPPPDEDVRADQHLLGEAVLGLIEGGAPRLDVGLAVEERHDGAMDSLRVDPGHLLIALLMTVSFHTVTRILLPIASAHWGGLARPPAEASIDAATPNGALRRRTISGYVCLGVATAYDLHKALWISGRLTPRQTAV